MKRRTKSNTENGKTNCDGCRSSVKVRLVKFVNRDEKQAAGSVEETHHDQKPRLGHDHAPMGCIEGVGVPAKVVFDSAT